MICFPVNNIKVVFLMEYGLFYLFDFDLIGYACTIELSLS